MLSLILLVFAFVLAVIAALNIAPEPHRTRLIAAALACYFAACIFGNEVISGLFKHVP